MLLGPCYRVLGRPYKRHPLHASSAPNSRRTIDFWGPCAVVSAYCIILWIGRVREVPWVFFVWACAAVLNHLVSRVWCHSSLMIHVALLGYSIVPLIPFSLLIVILRPSTPIGLSMEFVSIVWASLAAATSYNTIFAVSAEQRPRLRLLYPAGILMTLYFTSLIPSPRK